MEKIFIFFLLINIYELGFSQTHLDSFESADGWKIFQSDGVKSDISIVPGLNGNALKV